LVSAFRAGRQRARAMLVLGGIYTAGSLLASVLGSFLVGEPALGTPADSQTPEVDARMVLVLLLQSPLVVLFWHAPALVHWHGVSPVKSLFFSAVAFFRNFSAFVIYGFAWLAVFLAIGFFASSIGMMLGGLAVARSILLPTV